MEHEIIGSFLVNNDNIKYAYGKLTPDMFSEHLCSEAYKIILQNYQLGINTNTVELAKLMQNDIYDDKTLMQFAYECTMCGYNFTNELKSAIKSLIEIYTANQLKEICRQQSFLPKDIGNTLRNLNKATEEMLRNEKPKGKSLTDIATKYENYYGKEHPQGIRTGLYELDEILNGLNKGDVTILGARPAVGKSALATQILCNVAEKGCRVGYFNLEMTDQQILERVIARYSGINLLRLRKAMKFMDEEQKAYIKAIDKIKSSKGLFIFSGSYSATEIKMLCKNQDFDLVVIDYLQLVKPDKSYGNRVAEVGDVSKSIKSVAMEMKVPVIALSQLNRRKSSTDEPEIADLRESGDIEQDASNVILMWNIDLDGKIKGLKVEKNRQGELGKVALSYDGPHMSFDTINHESFSDTERRYKDVSTKSENGNPFN